MSKFDNSASKNFELKSSSDLNKILEIPKHELYLLIEQEKVNGLSIVPTSLNPGLDSDFIYEAYSPYFYLLHKQNEFQNGTKTTKPSIYVSSFSSVKQLITCPVDCLECSSKIMCLKCKPGFYENKGECLKCAPMCAECSGFPTNCQRCFYEEKTEFQTQSQSLGKNQNDSQTSSDSIVIDPLMIIDCEALIHLNCISYIQGYCDKCYDSLLVDGECRKTCDKYQFLDPFFGTCKECPKGCSACEYSGDCVDCLPGYILNNKKCLLECPSDQYLHFGDQQECRACPDNCLKCDSSHTCIRCKSEYFLSEEQTCLGCPYGCQVFFDPFICELCGNHFALEDGFCIQENISLITCLKATTTNQVSFLSDENTMFEEENQEIKIITNASGCLLPLPQSGCIFCRPEYYQEDYTCKPCSEGCLQCDRPDFCLQCASEYKPVSINATVFCELKVRLYKTLSKISKMNQTKSVTPLVTTTVAKSDAPTVSFARSTARVCVRNARSAGLRQK